MEKDILQERYGLNRQQLERTLVSYIERCIKGGYVQTRTCLYDLLADTSKKAIEELTGRSMDSLYKIHLNPSDFPFDPTIESISSGAIINLEKECAEPNIDSKRRNKLEESIKIIQGPVWAYPLM